VIATAPDSDCSVAVTLYLERCEMSSGEDNERLKPE
jgi:hypothetical protein